MNRKIIYTAAALVIVLLIGTVAIVLFKGKSSTPATLVDSFNPLSFNTYAVSVDMQNTGYTATINAGGVSKTIDEPLLSRYASVSFNSSVDIMWVSCPSAYTTGKGTSKTGNKIITDPIIGQGVELKDDKNQNNNIAFNCTKK